MNQIKLSDLVEISKGKKHELSNNGKRYIQIDDLRSSSNIKYTEDKKGISVDKNDLIIVWDGAYAGLVSYGLEGLIGSTLARLRLKEKNVFTPYLGRFLQSQMKLIQSTRTGSTIPHVSKIALLNIRIPLPPLEEQKRLAAILDKADEIRRNRQETIKLTEELVRSLFLDMFGDPVTNPKGWEKLEFEKIFSSIRYGTSTPPRFETQGIPFIRATNIKQGTIITKDLKFITFEETKKIEKCKLKKGDIVIVRSGVNSGDSALITDEYDGAYAGYDMIISIEPSLAAFYNYLINDNSGKQMIKPLTRRSGQPHINADQVKKLQFILPTKKLINEFNEYLQKITIQKNKLIGFLQESDTLFNCLIQKAFRGEL